AVPALATRSVAARVETALVNYGLYLGKLALPVNLAVFYPLAPGDAGLAVSAGLLLMAVTVLVWRDAALRTGWLRFLVTLLPVIGLVQVGGQQIADRYGYIPSIGVFVMVAWGAPRLSRVPWIPVASGVTTLVLAALVARQQVSYWRDSITLFEHAVAV